MIVVRLSFRLRVAHPPPPSPTTQVPPATRVTTAKPPRSARPRAPRAAQGPTPTARHPKSAKRVKQARPVPIRGPSSATCAFRELIQAPAPRAAPIASQALPRQSQARLSARHAPPARSQTQTPCWSVSFARREPTRLSQARPAAPPALQAPPLRRRARCSARTAMRASSRRSPGQPSARGVSRERSRLTPTRSHALCAPPARHQQLRAQRSASSARRASLPRTTVKSSALLVWTR